MKSMHILAGGMVLLIAVSACSPGADKQPSSAPKEAAGATASSEVQHGKGEGQITSIDAAKGTVTLDHGEIAELQWPPMPRTPLPSAAIATRRFRHDRA